MSPTEQNPEVSPTKSALRGSTGSSPDSGAGGHSPFLHSLHQRFRKSSSASAQSSDQPPPQPDLKSRNEASREAKRHLLSVIRDDWEYPSSAVKRPSTAGSREPVGYQRREDGLSDVESDTQNQRRRSKNDPYKFESPDAVADFVMERRAKRRRLFEEEMTWNLGLKNWAQQRDAWSGAVMQKPLISKSKASPEDNTKSRLSSTLHERNTSNSTTDDSINWPLSPHSPTPANSSSIDSVDFQPSNTTVLPGLPNFQTNSSPQTPSHPTTTTATTNDPDTSIEPYLPIYAPLFPPTHILRSRINPTAYPTTYSKVVLQSLSPNIPIPLTHMTPRPRRRLEIRRKLPPFKPHRHPPRS